MKTILVIEDQKLIRTIICDTLREFNYHTIEAGDGLEGLNIMENEKVSLVVTDLIMPNFDGLNFLEMVTSCHPGIELIALTSISKDHEMYSKVTRILGEDRIVQKSNDYTELVNKIKSIIG